MTIETRSFPAEAMLDLFYEKEGTIYPDVVVDGNTTSVEVEQKGRPVEHTRWHVLMEMVVRDVSDETYWSVSYRRAATENQDHDYDDPMVAYRVYPHQVTKTVFRTTP